MGAAEVHRAALGIAGGTDAEDIRRRHRRLMLRYHPDRAPRGREKEFLLRAQELNAARDWLLSHPSSWRREVPPTVAAPSPPTAAPESEPVMRVEVIPTASPTGAPAVEVPPSGGLGFPDLLLLGWRLLRFLLVAYLVILASYIAYWLHRLLLLLLSV